MKKWLFAALATSLFTGLASAQNFNPPPSDAQTKVEKLIGRYGNPERVYLTDAAKKTFEAKAGEIYIVAFLYQTMPSKTRMLVYEIKDGAKLNPRYPAYSKPYRSGSASAFSIRLDLSEETDPVTVFKIDADENANVLIYRFVRGVK